MKIIILDDQGEIKFEQTFFGKYIDKQSGKEKKLTLKILIDKFEDWVIEEFSGG